jgi:hypothetical protein
MLYINSILDQITSSPLFQELALQAHITIGEGYNFVRHIVMIDPGPLPFV